MRSTPPTGRPGVPRRVGLAVSSLPPDERKVVLLRDVAGMPLADVCAALDLDPEVARARLHSGRLRVHAAVAYAPACAAA